MRELITLIVCAVIFLLALQSGMVKTGLDFEVVKKNNESLQSTNERLTQEIRHIHNLSQGSDAASADQVAMLDRLERAKADLKSQLKRELKTREIILEETDAWLKLVLLDRALFSKHSHVIEDHSRQFLKKIAKVLSHFSEMEIRITGYTDSQKLSGRAKQKYPSLRHLATARAISVAEFFQKQGPIDPVQILTAGFGEVRPVAPNDSEYHRTLNGRIEISLYPINLERLNKSREIYRTEALIPSESKAPKLRKPQEEFEPEPEEIESIGEEDLDKVDDMEFDTGYEVPETLE